MAVVNILILGIVEGITEFLPVSSTFHLILASRLLKIVESDFLKLFEVVIQSGAILSVVWLYRRRLTKDWALIKKTLVAFIPTAVLGALLYKTIKAVFFESYLAQTAVFIGMGVLFLVFEFLVKKGALRTERTEASLTYGDALVVGLFQAAAFLPGVSRAGAVILTMMILGFRRSDSAFFSFFLSIPTMLSAGLYDLYKSREALLHSGSNAMGLAVGLAVAFVVAFFAVKWLISYLQRHKLSLFGWYRIVVGLAFLLFGRMK